MSPTRIRPAARPLLMRLSAGVLLTLVFFLPAGGFASGIPAGTSLVAVEAAAGIRSLDLPVYAHLTGSDGKEYALCLVQASEAGKPGRTLLAREAGGKEYLIALARRAGAREAARRLFDVLWDDGRHIVLAGAPGRADELSAMGFDIDWLADSPIDVKTVPVPPASGTPAYDERVQAIVDAIQAPQMDTILAGLSGDSAVTISGTPYTITTRNTRSGTPIQKATQYVFERLSSLGLSVSFHDWTYSSTSNRNVIAEKAGTTRSSEIVLITAHLDDMPSSGPAPGADDNGSGSAAVLRIAEVLNAHTFERTIRFVLFTGEEQGLYGSRVYANLVSANQENVVAVLNMDMIAWDAIGGPVVQIHTRTSASAGYAADKAIFELFAAVVSQYGLSSVLQPSLAADGESASDHSSFWAKGYPAVLAIEDDYADFNPYYHTSNDKRQNTNLAYFTAFTKAAAGTAALLGLPQAVPCAQPIVPVRFEADAGATSLTTGDLNGIMEPGEKVLFNPFWMLPESCTSRMITGQITSFGGPSGQTYTIWKRTADYGYMTPGAAESPFGKSGDAYVLSVGKGSRPATHWDANVVELLSTGESKSWTVHVGGSFLDVLPDNWAYPHVERLLHNGITAGISAIEYLPLGTVDRRQMAMFLARAIAGGEASVPVSGTARGVPYACTAGGTSLFADVAPEDPHCKHVHYIYGRRVTEGCDPGSLAYCPLSPVSRWQMAMFISRAVAGGDELVPLEDAAYSCDPGAPRLHFGDVSASDPSCRHVHYLWNRGTVSGCSTEPALFCPSSSTNRSEMAKFLSLGFDLGL
ncbi:MAG: Zn-dependent exopeptidase M28 [Acidobacteria bacterium]|nr:Zn-dependent exopeptidase M28 [Acidobacteriota bacterium]